MCTATTPTCSASIAPVTASAANLRSRPIVVEPPRGVGIDVRELWRFRELLFFLVWRDVKVRYKQTALGAAWAVLQPVVAMLIFTLVFGRFADIPSDGVPYAPFVFAGLLAWTYFGQALGTAGMSLVGNANLVTKIYFPRALIPTASVIAPLVDLVVAASALVVLLAWYGITPGLAVLLLPAFVLLAVATALGVGLLLAALTVRYRDVPFALPFLVQVWLFATPVVYPLSIVPEGWRPVFALNPMATVVEGFRWALLDRGSPDIVVVATSISVALALLVGGLVYFTRFERTFADVI